jgi:hypothetical protein
LIVFISEQNCHLQVSLIKDEFDFDELAVRAVCFSFKKARFAPIHDHLVHPQKTKRFSFSLASATDKIPLLRADAVRKDIASYTTSHTFERSGIFVCRGAWKSVKPF